MRSRVAEGLRGYESLPPAVVDAIKSRTGPASLLYVSTTHSVVSGALVIEKEMSQMGKVTKQQYPIYFISEVLVGSKKYYSEVEKICYVVVMSARKLRYYFEADTIRVLTNQPLDDIFGKRDNSG
jgi:hypothetical protein